MAGIDHVGLGSDFDGIDSTPEQLEDVSKYPLITQELLNRGYKQEQIRKVLGGNFMRGVPGGREGRGSSTRRRRLVTVNRSSPENYPSSTAGPAMRTQIVPVVLRSRPPLRSELRIPLTRTP